MKLFIIQYDSAEILKIFLLEFGRNDVFIKSFRFLLTFSITYCSVPSNPFLKLGDLELLSYQRKVVVFLVTFILNNFLGPTSHFSALVRVHRHLN
jgi:hypothetical protein